MDCKSHWENVYNTKNISEVSWHKAHLERSLQLTSQTGVGQDGQIIDVGGGASTLVDDLLASGFKGVSVLDVSTAAIDKAKARLGDSSNRVTWLDADITKIELPADTYDVWHDRAVFHFLKDDEDRKKYVEILRRSLKAGGHLITATFSLDGPSKCSGLDVNRYDPNLLSLEFGDALQLIDSFNEEHVTPSGGVQKFIYCRFHMN